MNKIVLTLLAALLCGGAFADDTSYLYWMIDPTDAKITQYSGDKESILDGSYAKVVWQNDETKETGYLNLYAAPNDASTAFEQNAANVGDNFLKTVGGGVFADVSSYTTGYSYFLEIWNEAQNDKLGYSTAVSYDNLAAYISTMKGSDIPADAYGFGSFMVPEPSSGVLMLIGCAVLALRRRKMQKKV